MNVSFPAHRDRGFTLVEVLVSVSLVASLMVILLSGTNAASNAWRDGQARTEAFQSGRTTLEIMAREITPAVVDTRMQFVVAPGETLTKAGAAQVAAQAPALLWMAPLGEDGGLRCVGYYLTRDPARKFYRLKRLFIAPADAEGRLSKYYPQIDARNAETFTSPTTARWFTRTWSEPAFDEESEDNSQAVVSTAADGVIALWVQCFDLLGRPIPLVSQAANHPKTDLAFNSAAFFQMATSTRFENGSGLLYLAETPQSMKANRLPQAVEFTIMTLDRATILNAAAVPEQVNVFDAGGALDVPASRVAYEELLHASRLHTARVFSTRARLLNGN